MPRKRIIYFSIAFILLVGIVTAGAVGRHYSERLKMMSYSRMGTAAPAPSRLDAARDRLRAMLGPAATLPLPEARLIVYKKERRVELYNGKILLKTYRIALGPTPTGHKQRKGDGKTPEGSYHISRRLARSSCYLFLGVNYPNATDARAGRDRGAIDQATCDKLVRLEEQRQDPPSDTKLSGAIGLHGGGAQNDWTLGCMALDATDIEELWVATAYWTPVEIKP